MEKLIVDDDYLEKLATYQDAASQKSAEAAKVAADVAGRLSASHGAVSGASNKAAKAAEAAREKAAASISADAAALAQWLRDQKVNYRAADEDFSHTIDRQLPDR